MAKQTCSALDPETTTLSPADRIEDFRDQRDALRARRAQRRAGKTRDKLRFMRKHVAKTQRDPLERTMPDTSRNAEINPEIFSARTRYALYCAILDGKAPEPDFEDVVLHAWGHASDLTSVLKGTDMGKIMPDDIITLKYGVHEFGLWLVLLADAHSFTLCQVDVPPMSYDPEPDQQEPMNVALKGHSAFAQKYVLVDMTLELPVAFVTPDLFTRVGWAKPFELDEIMSLSGQTRSDYSDTEFAEMQREHLRTLAEMWKVRQERCIKMAF